MDNESEILNWCREESHSSDEENLFVKKLRAGGLNDDQIIIVIETLNNTCRHCFNSDLRCYCSRDD